MNRSRVLLRLAVFAVLSWLSPSDAAAQFGCPTAQEIQIQQALDAAAQAGGGVVQLDRGVYHACGTLVIGSNVHLRGAGHGATIIRGSTAVAGKVVAGAYLGASIGGAGVRNVTVSDLTVDHRTYGRHANGISFVPTGSDYNGTVPVNILIEHVEVLGAPLGYHNYLIWNLKGQHVKIRDNWLDGGYSIPPAIPVPQEGIESFGGYDVLITGNTVKGVGGACINAGSAGIPNSTSVGVVITQNYVFGCTMGINLGTSSENGGQHNVECKVADNVVLYAAAVGINITAAAGTVQRNLHLSGNNIRIVGPGPDAVGIRIWADPTADVGPITVAGNHVHTVFGTYGRGILVETAPNVRLLDNTISNTSGDGITGYGADDLEVTGNRIERPGVYGVYVGPSAARIVVTQNTLSDWSVASPAVMVEGTRYGAVHRNLFKRTDGGRATAIAAPGSCGVEMNGNQALYGGPAANILTPGC